ncbi:acyl-CoA thioester hydrolase, YbgC/YbaW family [Belliella baltica DSM 15883]|uniref:Acyl-CoA thioester hydrolase, YbgC/YbaW family n=1 Tax=Belliella baltica (strain DSM 15883 / CIP 108006 / LMG 21964 / BA134) TaxID=866536 RepID=I3Z6A5_BELBD|nr:thioesterase family protein [Belliella baltica]AFL84773.1 acyl-CoA thioester hydrolase, YbgC/YbaW family [Belliella baltica DSM 15883]
MFQAETQIRVRYAETDQMGYVYYGNYAMYFEVGRVEALRSAGFSYKKMEEDGIMMPVLEQTTKYLRPGKYDELLTIKTTINEMPGIRIAFEYEVFNEQRELITIGKTILTFLKKDTHRPSRPPQYLLDLLKPYFE